jgi:hypothetical protein
MAESTPLKGKIIGIDPGHNGLNPTRVPKVLALEAAIIRFVRDH